MLYSERCINDAGLGFKANVAPAFSLNEPTRRIFKEIDISFKALSRRDLDEFILRNSENFHLA